MITLPSDSRFDLWRGCGADIPAMRVKALSAPAQSAGQTTITEKVVLNQRIIRGTLGPNGERLTSFYFPKSLYQLFGTGSWGNSGTPRYAWGDGFFRCQSNTLNILMDLDFICLDRTPFPHNYEEGFNPVYCSDPSVQLIVINCGFWNCDSALVIGGDHSHAYSIEIGAKGTKRTGLAGHYGVRSVRSNNAIEKVKLHYTLRHDVSTQTIDRCVHKDLEGPDLTLDFHATQRDDNDDNNLYLNTNHGKASQVISMGGNFSNRPWDGDGSTFYNLRDGAGTLIPNSKLPSWLHATVIPYQGSTLPPPPPTDFVVGSSVQAIAPIAYVRSGPAKSYPSVGSQPTGAQGTLAEGPVVDTVPSPDIIYWRVPEFGGWVGQDKLMVL